MNDKTITMTADAYERLRAIAERERRTFRATIDVLMDQYERSATGRGALDRIIKKRRPSKA